jgi:uncharacterized protein (DUF305 family)
LAQKKLSKLEFNRSIKIPFSLTFGGLFALLSVAIVGCTSAPEASTTGKQEVAQQPSSMPGVTPNAGTMPHMDHGAMDMSLGPKDADFDLRFIDGMTPHHEGAIVMAQEALQKSQRPEIKQLAQAIIAAQEIEITQMKDWRKTWYPPVAETPMMYDNSMGHMMPMSEEMRSSMMMNTDLGSADDQFDLRFINAMIPHHEGALTMAKEALEKSDRPEVKQLAQAILDSQQKEIDQMTQWRKVWYSQ